MNLPPIEEGYEWVKVGNVNQGRPTPPPIEDGYEWVKVGNINQQPHVNYDRGFLGDVASRAARGSVQALKGVGGALRMSDLDPESDTGIVSSIGKKVTDFADDVSRQYGILKPDIGEVQQKEGFVKRGFLGGVESVPASLLPLVGGVATGAALGSVVPGIGTTVGGIIGGGLTLFGTFGLGEYQNTYDETKKTLLQKGYGFREAKDLAHDHALTSALAEVGGEAVGDIAGAVVFKAILKTAVKNGLKQTVKQLAGAGGVKEFAKNLSRAMPFEVGSEVGTAYVQAKSAKETGVSDTSTSEAMAEAVLPAAFMSLMFGASIRGLQGVQARGLYSDLNGDDPVTRAKAAIAVSKRMEDVESRRTWLNTADQYIKDGKPIPLDKPIIDFAIQKAEQESAQDNTKQGPPEPPPGGPTFNGFEDFAGAYQDGATYDDLKGKRDEYSKRPDADPNTLSDVDTFLGEIKPPVDGKIEELKSIHEANGITDDELITQAGKLIAEYPNEKDKIKSAFPNVPVTLTDALKKSESVTPFTDESDALNKSIIENIAGLKENDKQIEKVTDNKETKTYSTGSELATALYRNGEVDLESIPTNILRAAGFALSSTSMKMPENDSRAGQVYSAIERVDAEIKKRESIDITPEATNIDQPAPLPKPPEDSISGKVETAGKVTQEADGYVNKEIIPYSKDLKIKNIDALPRGVGARYLLAIKDDNDGLIAKQWRRTIPHPMNKIEVLIDFKPETEESKPAPKAEGKTTKPEAKEREYIYKSPMRPLWMGFGKVIGQEYTQIDANTFSTKKPLSSATLEKLDLEALDQDHPANIKKRFTAFRSDMINKLSEGATEIKLDDGTIFIYSDNMDVATNQKNPYRITRFLPDGTPAGHDVFKDFDEVSMYLWGYDKQIKSIRTSTSKPEAKPAPKAEQKATKPKRRIITTKPDNTKMREALSITTDDDTLNLVLSEMMSDLQSGEKGGMIGKDADGEAIYAKSGHAQWYQDLAKQLEKENKQAKKDGYSEIPINKNYFINVIDKGLKGSKLTNTQNLAWERLNQIANREANGHYAPIVNEYTRFKEAENERIQEGIARLEAEGIDAGRIQESSESVSADIDSEIEAQGYSAEQIENAGELDLSFAFGANKQQTTKLSPDEVKTKQTEIAGTSEAENFSLDNPETDMSKHRKLSEQKQTKNEDIPFQRGPKSTGLQQSQVQSVIDKAVSSIPNAPKVNVVQSNKDCPTEVQKIMENEGITDAMGFTYKGEVYLVADNLRNQEEVLRTLAHELTHSGLGKFFQRQTKGKIMTVRVKYEALMDSIYRAHSKEIEQLAKTTHTHLNTRTAKDRRQACEEWLCNQSYEAQSKWYDKLVAIFHDLLRAIGLDVKLSDAEVRVVLQDAFKEFGSEGVSFMTAWHGSPHDFDKFSKDKIGTGEGAQAYGYGLYFAGKKEVGEYYRKSFIRGLSYDNRGVSVDRDTVDVRYVDSNELVKDDAARLAILSLYHNMSLKQTGGEFVWGDNVQENIKMMNDAQTLLSSGVVKKATGRLYQVELAPAEDEYLLWDKPLSEQSEKVKAAINNIHHSNYMNAFSQQDVQHYLESQKGADLYQDLSATRGVRLNEQSKGAIRNEPDDKWASDYLHSLGIRGIKYLDGSSRGKGEGDYNYVIFSDDDIEVTAKFERRGLKDTRKSANIQDGWDTLQIDSSIRNHWKKKVEEQNERDRNTKKDTVAGDGVTNDSRNIRDEQLSLPSGTELGRILERQIQKTRGKAEGRWIESAVLDLSFQDAPEFRLANKYFSSFGYTVIPIGKVEWLGSVNHTDKIALVSHLTGDSFSYFMSHEISHILSNQGNSTIVAIKENLNTQHPDFVTINDILGMGEEFTREEIASSLVGGWDRYKHLLTGKDSNKSIQDARKAVIDSTPNEPETKFQRQEKEAFDEASEPTPPEYDLGDLESKRKELDDYRNRLRRSLEFPETVMLARDLLGGKFPIIMAKLRSAFGNSALGKFIPQGEGNILLKAGIFSDIETASKVLAHEIGHLVDYLPNHLMTRGNILGRIASLNRYMKNYLEEFKGAPGLLTDEDRKRLQKEAREQVKSEEKPDEVIVEEIIKEIPQYEYTGITPEIILDLMKGRIEGKVAPELYEYLQRAETKEKKRIVLQAMKQMVDERVAQFGSKKQVGTETVRETVERVIPGVKADAQTIYNRFKELLQKEVDKRVLYRREVITDELKKLTKIWSPFDDSRDSSYRKYRWSSKELYADAFSVFINYPELMQKEAPTFHKAFLSWIESKPQVKETYDAYQELATNREAVQERREKYHYEMYKGHKTIEQEIMEEIKADSKISPRNILRELYKGLIDRNVSLMEAVKKLKKAGKTTAANTLEYFKEERNYLASEADFYLEEVKDKIIAPLEQAGFTEDDLGYLGELMRTATQRRDVANPGGMGGYFSDEQIEHLKTKLGTERFNTLKGLLEKFSDLRQEHIIPKLEEAGMYSEALLNTMKTEKNYLTFNVTKFMDKMYGGHAQSALGKVYHTIGTFQKIQNPFIATVMKDISLMRAAEITMYKKELHRTFSENEELQDQIQPAEKKFNGTAQVFVEPEDPKMGMIAYLKNGKVEAFYITKEIADDFNNKPVEAMHILKFFNAIMMPVKALLVNRNPIWMFRNVVRDYLGTAQNIPGAKVTNLLPYYRKAFMDAWGEVMQGKKLDVVQTMKKGKMLVIDRQYHLSDDMSDDTEFDKLYAKFGHHGEKQRQIVIEKILQAWDFLGDLGKVSERAGKIAGYRWMKENTNMTEREIGHVVRSRIGTPDVYRRGAWQLVTNNLFLYSNVGKEGFRSSWESFQDNKAAYTWKLVKYNIMPKAVLALAALGAFGDDAEDIIKRISNYDKANYLVVPFAKTADGRAVYLRMPQSYTGQVLGAIMWDIFNLEFKKATESVAGMQPYSFNPVIKAVLNWGLYAMDTNPQDWYRGQNIVNRKEWDAGEPYRLIEMSKNTWNSLGGGLLYKFNKGQDPKGVWEQISSLPGLNILGSFLKESNQGLKEEYYKASQKAKQASALKSLDKDEAVAKRERNKRKLSEAKSLLRKGFINYDTYKETVARYQ